MQDGTLDGRYHCEFQTPFPTSRDLYNKLIFGPLVYLPVNKAVRSDSHSKVCSSKVLLDRYSKRPDHMFLKELRWADE